MARVPQIHGERVNYFFYGTLMDATIAARVTGTAITAARLRPATLAGYARVRVEGEHYPALVDRPGASVAGKLLRNVGPEAQRRLAVYEEPMYELRWVEARGVGDMRVAALVFVAGPTMRLTDEEWDFDNWAKTYRRPFLMALNRWMRGSHAEGGSMPPRADRLK